MSEAARTTTPANTPVDAERHLPLNPRDVLVLTALASGPLHGYGLIQQAEELSEGRVRIDPANLYRVLKKLERDGLVAAAAEDETAGAGRRRDYAITSLGRTVLGAEAERLGRLAGVALRDLCSSDRRA